MAKTLNDIMGLLEVTDDTTLPQLIEKYNTLSVVQKNELDKILQISVMPLPNQVQGQADNVKQRMYGIVANEDDGSVSVMNKRYALLKLINDRINNKLNSLDNHNKSQDTDIKDVSSRCDDNATNISNLAAETNKAIKDINGNLEKTTSISLNSIHDICKSKYKEDQVNE